MRILIVEDELYLAQSIANKLSDRGYECDFAATVKEALSKGDFDAVLLSTNISGQNFLPVVHHFKHAIIILMVSYINNDTVSVPLKEGANDYILKPFMIEELVRKIEHFSHYELLKAKYTTLNTYLQHTFSKAQSSQTPTVTKYPVILKATHQTTADGYAFALAEKDKRSLEFVVLGTPQAKHALTSPQGRSLLYAVGLETLKKNEREEVLRLCENRPVILSTTGVIDSGTITVIELSGDHAVATYDDILDIDTYIQTMITTFQETYPDTELSKKLGISRKSLWEKRKKYDLFKRK